METNSNQIHPGHLEDENPSPMEIESNDNAEEVVIPETQFPTSSIITSDEEDIEISGQPLKLLHQMQKQGDYFFKNICSY